MELLDNISLFENTYLWKYMDFHRFTSLSFTKQLVFTRLDKLDDPIEGIKRDYLMHNLSAEMTPDDPNELNPNIPEPQRLHIVANKKYFESIKQDEKEKTQKSQFVNCWFLGNRESMAMWNLYSSQLGLVIKADAKNLIELVSKSFDIHESCFQKHKTYGGLVTYLKINPFDPFDFTQLKKVSGYKKDLSYSYENEFRFMVAVSDSEIRKDEIIKIDVIDIESFNMEILAHPNIKEWQFDNIKTIAKNSFPTVSVAKSRILLKN